jgi:hypothetical protein
LSTSAHNSRASYRIYERHQAKNAEAFDTVQLRGLLSRLMLEIVDKAEEPDHRAEARQALSEVLERVVLEPENRTVATALCSRNGG